jgi:putative flippase GtrA
MSPFHGNIERMPRPVRECLGYGLCSAAALAVDYGLLIGLTELAGLGYLAAAAIGFSAGILVVYVMSVRFVFEQRRLDSTSLELGGFVAIGLAGLALNQTVLWAIVSVSPLNYQLAKIPTALVVFLFNFTMRRALLFSSRT